MLGWVATPRLPCVVTTAVDKVAQIFNLPYRRFVIGRVADACWRFERTHPLQNAILRYSRLKICATLSLALQTHTSGEYHPSGAPEIRSPMAEARKKAENRNPNPVPCWRVAGLPERWGIRASEFGFLSGFGFRVSDLGGWQQVAVLRYTRLKERGGIRPGRQCPPR